MRELANLVRDEVSDGRDVKRTISIPKRMDDKRFKLIACATRCLKREISVVKKISTCAIGKLMKGRMK